MLFLTILTNLRRKIGDLLKINVMIHSCHCLYVYSHSGDDCDTPDSDDLERILWIYEQKFVRMKYKFTKTGFGLFGAIAIILQLWNKIWPTNVFHNRRILYWSNFSPV
jgi:hypothetical protein